MKKQVLLSALLLFSIVLFAQIPTAGLIAKYYFNSGNTNDDISSNNAINNGATLTTDRFGNANSAYNFNGIHYIKVPYYSALNVSTGLSISVWIKQSSNATQQALVSRWKNSKASDQYLLMMNGAAPMVAVGNPSYSANGFTCSNANVPINQWNHLVMEWKNNGDHKLFVNGVRTDSTRLTAFATINAITTNDLYFGAQLATFMDRYFLGKIDDIRIYNRELTHNEVLALYNETDYTTSTIEIASTEFNIYPNPANGLLNINLGSSQNASVKIYALSGQLMLANENASGLVQLDISSLSSGIYFTEVSSLMGTSRTKFVVE